MKNKIQPTRQEKVMREHDFIVSKTDTKGIITYGNRVFIEYSGYTEAELLGAQHNIIRHPDMPRGVFKLLWDTISSGHEIFAYVKNMAKDGSFYWVFANVTPDYDEQGRIIGYYSVRRCPKRSAVEICADLYQQMLAEEQRAGPRDACAASVALLQSVLSQKGVSYEQLVLSL
ncbi:MULTISPECIES: PAS domain-containing protein [unclassified Paludibacterium]|uniref:PAS domain-containing protein n=1 Tax=unclassified Paludibacterium TaxID=2618429 RepID=UPI001C05CDFF|nr:PAS domain-containing protein [Paludibacterium sp. B53371]BEV72577.1 PAS domain-containing protein [Paludibacterium sp. THUN1379]